MRRSPNRSSLGRGGLALSQPQAPACPQRQGAGPHRGAGIPIRYAGADGPEDEEANPGPRIKCFLGRTGGREEEDS